jgi:hypothetical protein
MAFNNPLATVMSQPFRPSVLQDEASTCVDLSVGHGKRANLDGSRPRVDYKNNPLGGFRGRKAGQLLSESGVRATLIGVCGDLKWLAEAHNFSNKYSKKKMFEAQPG